MSAPLAASGSDPVQQAATLGCLKETRPETRVALTPNIVAGLVKDGYKVVVEKGCGIPATFGDSAYEQAGAAVASRADVMRSAQVIFTVQPPEAEFGQMRGKVVVGWVGRLLPTGKALVTKATSAGVTLIDVTAVPRITIAQKLDVLSSQAKVAGIRSVLEAAHSFGRFQSSEITAAGKYPPSKTFVLGCGVAGLAAIGQAKALGSVVKAWDVRDVSDQAASLGAGWVRVEFKEAGEGVGGYAKESSPEFQEAQKKKFHEVCKESDIVITTAAIPGRPSPLLVEEYMVKDMKPGSVIVDLAAAGGGNCKLTKKGERYVTENGVTVIGFDNLPCLMPSQSSLMFAQNMQNLVRHIHGKDGSTALLSNIDKHLAAGENGDIVTRSIVCCKNNQELVMPKPPNPTAINKPKEEAPKAPKKETPLWQSTLTSAIVMCAVLALLCFMGTSVPVSLLSTFVLAGAAGYQVVWGVVPALHTPLMAVTNAISGLTAVGGLLLFNQVETDMAQDLAVAATLVSFVNIFGGFVVSLRLLNLFKRKGDKDYSKFFLLTAVLLVTFAVTNASDREAVETLSGLLCIAAIGGLASMKTSNMGSILGVSGVATAVEVTFLGMDKSRVTGALILMGIGAVLGLLLGGTVSTIRLPQTVALFHSFVGLAAMLTSIGEFVEHPEVGPSVQNIFGIAGNFIGGVTLTGSIIAFLKLDGRMSSAAWNLPCKNLINLVSLCTFFGLIYLFLTADNAEMATRMQWATALLACWMGIHLVASVGGGDMPVCITVLNSYSGWALVAEGFMLDNAMLTIVGSLIGFSGAILTFIMCKAMNRDIFNVIFGGMNTVAPMKKDANAPPEVHTEIKPEQVAEMLADAKEVMIIPGYGMAVARAQSQVATIANTCRENGVNVRFGIHPVAGRMPGQMNVLLAEASVPYDWVFEMDEVNDDMKDIDVCLVVGANDITNKSAQDMEGCPIYGMPVLKVWECKKTVFFKRSMKAGYADIPNPVFYYENTDMCLGNADKTCQEIANKVGEAFKSRQ